MAEREPAAERLKRHRSRAERATVAVEMDEARLAAAVTADEQTAHALSDLKASLKGAKQYVKRLSAEVTVAQQMAKSARKERRVAEEALTGHRISAQKRASKLASAESAAGTEQPTEPLSTTARAPRRTAPRVATTKATSSKPAAARAAATRDAATRGVARKAAPRARRTISKQT